MGSDVRSRWEKARRSAPAAGVVVALVVGATLRLSFRGAIEWKSDEKWTYLHAQIMAAHGGWPAIGLPSSMGPPHAGASLWVFGWLARVFGVRTPPDLAAAVQVLNTLALVAFAAFVFLAVPKARREPWLWAVGLWAVNPVAVILERKIWPPSVLTLPMVGLLAAWWYRRRPAAAFAWGLLGALMTQVHIGVAFLAFALLAWTVIHDRGGFPWTGWLAGSAVGLLPAIPWAMTLLSHGAASHSHLSAPSMGFYGRWFTQFFGNGTQYTLGKRNFAEFLAWPQAHGFATYAIATTEVVLLGMAAVVLARSVRAAVGPSRPALQAILLGDSPETLLITAVFFGYGGLLTVLTFFGAGSYRHYLIVVAPIMALWTAMLTLWSDRGARRRWARQILATLVVLQAALSFCLLVYIDQTDVIACDFGVSWQAQQKGAVAPRPAAPPGRDDCMLTPVRP